MENRKIIYYEDELNDEFSLAKITPITIDKNYKYCNDSAFKRFTRFFWYRIVAHPIAFLYTKLVFAHKIIGADKMKPYAKRGLFLFGNHTQDVADAFIPNLLCRRQRKYFIVHPNNVSMPLLGKITPSLGALPIPSDLSAYPNFIKAIEKRFAEGNAIVVYPEAHIWPYYTEIRPFLDTSFHYPVKLSSAVFCFTNTYSKKRIFGGAKITTYVDGPFFPDNSLSVRDQRKKLRDEIYETMRERSKLSDYKKIQYVKKEAHK